MGATAQNYYNFMCFPGCQLVFKSFGKFLKWGSQKILKRVLKAHVNQYIYALNAIGGCAKLRALLHLCLFKLDYYRQSSAHLIIKLNLCVAYNLCVCPVYGAQTAVRTEHGNPCWGDKDRTACGCLGLLPTPPPPPTACWTFLTCFKPVFANAHAPGERTEGGAGAGSYAHARPSTWTGPGAEICPSNAETFTFQNLKDEGDFCHRKMRASSPIWREIRFTRRL